ncbi:type IX secretion system anionic LPS delivery protein PorZ [Seonamhaeicola marinus]|uniref:ABC transporter substrate-binding protein n=1 Tax=Seonamhaeicola marinus TaxID=1912246 RepID=A0A5D0HUU8_9FLAO|nr:two-component regulator propeller domain-containing protein [Seonamhaeicola marinus]TYA73917.1 ABC transporter substrate-binding protein [Seonamhaeicola marinus]
MFKRVLLVVIFLIPLKKSAQDYSNQWQGHFSYYEITEVIKTQNKIYAASNNAVFSFDLQTNEIEEFNTVNGLSGETISTIYYSEIHDLLIVGYINGLIEVVFNNDDDVLSVVDILEKTTIQPNDKRINHFNEYEDNLYISTNFGISVFNLQRLEFGDTFFIGANGSQVKVNQTTIFNNNIYASCSNSNAIKKGALTNPNLINYQNWDTISTGNYLFIQNFNNRLFAIGENRRLYEIINDNLLELALFTDSVNDIKTSSSSLVITTTNNVYVYNETLALSSQIPIDPNFDTDYLSAIVDGNNTYIGSKHFGVLESITSNTPVFEEIRPDGPLLNTPFSIKYENGNLWVVYGGYSATYNWNGGKSRTGISLLSENNWSNINFNSISSEISDPLFLSHIAINPNDSKQVYISSYYSGLIEINDGVFSLIYNQNNSTLSPFVNNFHLTLTSNYDNDGNLWVTNGRVDRPLNKFSNGNWESFDFTSLIGNRFNNIGFSNIEIDSNNNLFFGSFDFGIIGFSENGGNQILKSIMGEDNNMPSNNVTSCALDNRNQLWIGTDRGIRVLYNSSSFFEEDNVVVEEIIIEEDGIAKELLFQQLISTIKVDGSNNKWVGTADSGIFYFSSDGQNTIHHFTKSNSPLPSNTINDISIDGSNGVVYIATSRGLVSFNSGSSSPFEDLTNAYAYPNPVRPGFNMVDEKIKIKDISENVNIKITDIEGNLVAEAQSRVNQRFRGYNLEIDGGTAYWNGKNLANNLVASGVYLIMLSDLDTFETNVIKLMVVR